MKHLVFLVTACAALVLGTAGCTTESYCFGNCGDDGTGRDGGHFDGGGGTNFMPKDGGDEKDGGCVGFGCGGRPNGCTETNAGVEICDGIDNDCDGDIDEAEDIDFTKPENCGNCEIDCTQTLGRVTEPVCDTEGVVLGEEPGTCNYTECSGDFYDVDGDRENGCEYYCQWNPDGDNASDPGGEDGCGKDDDCDGTIDEDVDLCGDVENCGVCGKRCVVSNGTPKCETTAEDGEACNNTNTACKVDECDPGYHDVDGSAANGCEYQCELTNGGVEICDGLDNDCDQRIDNHDPDLETDDPAVGTPCFGGEYGICAAEENAGVNKCIAGTIQCCDISSDNEPPSNPNLPESGVRNGVCKGQEAPFVVRPNDEVEVCDGLDNDCDSQADEDATDAGAICGTSVGTCETGLEQCVDGALVCVGGNSGSPEICDGFDNDCDGIIDASLRDSGGARSNANCTTDAQCANKAPFTLCYPVPGGGNQCVIPPSDIGDPCDVPPTAPNGVTQPCRGGVTACFGGALVCSGSVLPTETADQCGEDSNCDGAYTPVADLDNDVENCGQCGFDCNEQHAGGHGVWDCQAGQCVRTSCEPGYIDCQAPTDDCETACPFQSGAELCNGLDDNCDCQVDNVPAANTPSPVQVCGVSALATDPRCTAGTGNQRVRVTCSNGGWQCQFPSGYCNQGNPASCAATSDRCDGRDNNCNGGTDEDYKAPARTSRALGASCTSEDVYRDLQCATSGNPSCPPQAPPHGVCGGTGTYACASSGTDTVCSATFNAGAAGPELCDGLDNDCDTLVDETFNNKGSNTTYFVKPEVVRLGTNLWIYQYEASRPGANATQPGNGNGYWCTGSGCSSGLFNGYGGPAAPSGVQLNRTPACSQPGDVPWFNVTPVEVEQTCHAMGGFICDRSEWQMACEAGNNCGWGYAPLSNCSAAANYTNRFCNLHQFDFDTSANGIQDGLLPGGSNLLSNCNADWRNTTGNPSGDDRIFDITGNVREITRETSTVYKVMGGAYNTQAESGASCDFDFYSVTADFKLFDTGFRCCFSSDPRL